MKKNLNIFLLVFFVSGLFTACNNEPKIIADIENGKVVYEKVCMGCHKTGLNGSAALDDTERWEEISDKNIDTLQNQAIRGYDGKYGLMPERGTCPECSDQDLLDAIIYMFSESGFPRKFKEAE
ncbi:MAG: c-type cytochrome [Bacteroidota bacterium]|nr:c-type cytochrome [Bacteroidota bacterium]